MPFINTGIYGDGDLYHSDVETPGTYIAKQEAHAHYIALRIKFTAALIPGAIEAFRILRSTLEVAPDSQSRYTHEAFIDRAEMTDRISAIIKHTGSEFIIKHVQLLVKPKRAKAKG